MSEAEDIAREEANGHSIFGASGSSRYLACPGSVRASFGLPDTARYEAAEGTVAHGLAEQWLRTGVKPIERLGTTETVNLFTGTYDIPIDAAMMAFVEQYVDWCNGVPGDHYHEQRVDYSVLTPIPNQGGTADHFAARPKWLVLTDLKYGVADQIHAYHNPQVSLYALGVIYEWDWLYDFEKVTIRICQPRLGHFDEWHTTKEELLQFADWAKGRMHQAWDPNPPFVPGEKQCRYCKARLTCDAAIRWAERLIDDTFDDESFDGLDAPSLPDFKADHFALAPVEPMTTERLANLVSWRKWAETLFKSTFEELDRRAKAGDIATGWMLAEGKSSRRLEDRDGVVETLDILGIPEEDAYDRKIKSPAKLEKLLVAQAGRTIKEAKALLKPYVRVVPGGSVLAPVGRGKRKAVDATDDVFEDEL
ncbi:Protein of unknown function DUF2800 [uncultured Caudovirales phage]|uniref:DUF2800 domain-containing protein n=1 Tax=uncultured Caudovirales phage TaxID=2100421 RepID=A0A6J5P2W4_9CAUD|nr:Protein of unknown function DUF2800 [uncultured Caudovirales phage]